MIPRIGELPQNGRQYRHRPGVYAILPLGNEVLITHECAARREFQLPGGGIDPGESPLMALHREVIEETGWRIARPRRLGAFRRFVFMPDYDFWAEKLCHIYVAHPVRQLAEPSDPGHTVIWTQPETAVRILANDGDRAFLSHYFS